MHVRPSYREKWVNLRKKTLKPNMRLYNRVSRLQRPHNKNYGSMAKNASMPQGKFTRGLGKCFPCYCCRCAPFTYRVCTGTYHTLTCTLLVYKPTVRPVANHSLCFATQVVTLLLGECTFFACANLYFDTSYLLFQQNS